MVGSEGVYFPECPSGEGLWQDRAKAPPDFGTYPGRACSIFSLPSSTQPSHSGMWFSKVLDTAGKYRASFFQYLCKMCVILVAMLQSLKGKTWFISSGWAKVLFFSYHTLLQLPLLRGLPQSHTTSLWTAQFSLLAYRYPTTSTW